MNDSGLILFPEALLASVPALYSTESFPAEQKVAHIKVFDPCGRGTWYACEFSPEEGLFFGYVVSPLGPDCDEGLLRQARVGAGHQPLALAARTGRLVEAGAYPRAPAET